MQPIKYASQPALDTHRCGVDKPIIEGAANLHGPLVSNRMARFTHQEGFPDPEALFEVQIKAVAGESVRVDRCAVAAAMWRDLRSLCPCLFAHVQRNH